MEQSLISVCIPTYNGSQFLDAALDCVRFQTYRHLEVIFSDDESTDDTIAIAESFAAEGLFPTTILRHKRSTLAGNWDNCTRHARGKYIKFLFQDDLLAPTCIAKMVETAERESGIGLVFCARELLLDGEARDDEAAARIFKSCAHVHQGWSNLKSLQEGKALLADPALMISGTHNKIGEPTAVLLHRELLASTGGFDGSLRQLIDVDMWWRMLAVGKVAFIDEPLATFRIHTGQESIANARAQLSQPDLVRFAKKTLCGPLQPMLHPTTVWTLRQYVAKLGGIRGRIWAALFYAQTLQGRLWRRAS